MNDYTEARTEEQITHDKLMRETFGRDGYEFFEDMFDYPAPKPRMNLLREYPHLPQISNEYE